MIVIWARTPDWNQFPLQCDGKLHESGPGNQRKIRILVNFSTLQQTSGPSLLNVQLSYLYCTHLHWHTSIHLLAHYKTEFMHLWPPYYYLLNFCSKTRDKENIRLQVHFLTRTGFYFLFFGGNNFLVLSTWIFPYATVYHQPTLSILLLFSFLELEPCYPNNHLDHI